MSTPHQNISTARTMIGGQAVITESTQRIVTIRKADGSYQHRNCANGSVMDQICGTLAPGDEIVSVR